MEVLAILLIPPMMLAQVSGAGAIRMARETLARELGVRPRAIAVLDVEPVEWPDAALGCPEKGVQYTQVITPGYRMVLELGGKRYPMHVGAGRAVRCDAPPLGTKVSREDVLAAARAQDQARRDLARRLKLRPADVKVNFVRPMAFAAGGAACHPTRPGHAEDSVKGHLIELTAAGRHYRYRAVGETVVSCESPE